MRQDHLDEEEFFHRKQKIPRRLKTRRVEQEVSGLLQGRVIAVTGEGVVVLVEGKEELCSVKGVVKKERSGKTLVVVGDRVLVERPGRIASIEERSSFLARQDPYSRGEQLIAANIDQVLIVASLLHPPLKPTFIDRILISAEQGNIHPIIVINKIDLLAQAKSEESRLYHEFLMAYEPLGIPLLSISAKDETGLESLRSLMHNKTSAIAGQSGVGKSSLLNAAFGLRLRTGDLTQKYGKGAHTTTTARLLPLPQGGFCIDTPGIRSFGFLELKKERIQSHFREFASFASDCRYPDCTHLQEPHCAVRKALEEKQVSSLRFSSYQGLMEELLQGTERRQQKKEE